MAFQVSPGVRVTERDLTNIIPAVSTSIGGFAGNFEWGPVNQIETISSEADLISKFGYPRVSSDLPSHTRDDWYAAVTFLGYSSNLQLVRVGNNTAKNSSNFESYETNSFYITSFTGGEIPPGGDSTNLDSEQTFTLTFTDDNDSDYIVTYDAAAGAYASTVQNALMRRVNQLEGFTAEGSWSNGGFEFTTVKNIISVTFETSASNVQFTYNPDVALPEEPVAGNVYLTLAAANSSVRIDNDNDFLDKESTLPSSAIVARFPGKLGDGIGVVVLDANFDSEDRVLFGDNKVGDIFDTVPGTSAWVEENEFTVVDDEVHVVVYTTDTRITGTANQILERFPYMSKASNAKTADGASNYYKKVVNTQSQWIYIQDETGDSEADAEIIGTTLDGTQVHQKWRTFENATNGMWKVSLANGTNGTEAHTDDQYTEAYDLFNDAEVVDVSLLFVGKANQGNSGSSKVVQKHVIEICEDRKDCVAFVSPDYTSAVSNPTSKKIVEYFNNSTDGFNSTSYAMFDSGWKRVYDRYNDEYFWTPLNADMAGLCARTDYTNEAWFSPAGLNRGFVRDVVKLSFNPTQTQRDELYVKRVNPVVTLRGQGTILYGDKTGLSRPSAFDRINVRRLFIVLQKAISTASRYQLFEFNDDLTRATFVNALEPFLADIQSRRGLTDFKIICDESNNTPEVIDGNRFVADIYIKPTRSINFVTLNFTAVRSGVSFSEVVGG